MILTSCVGIRVEIRHVRLVVGVCVKTSWTTIYLEPNPATPSLHLIHESLHYSIYCISYNNSIVHLPSFM